MIKSASQSSLTNDVKYRNLDTFNVPSSEYLIETISNIGTGVTSLTFNNLAQYAGVYRHLQIVGVLKTSSGNGFNTTFRMRFNGDTGNNYSTSNLYTTDGGVKSGSESGQNAINLWAVNPNGVSAGYQAFVMNILDPYQTKNKSVRTFDAAYQTGTSYQYFIQQRNGLWASTAQVQSINFSIGVDSFDSLSRFSLRGDCIMALQSTTALATITLQSSTSEISFSNIPLTYRDLVLVVEGISNTASNAYLYFNGDNTNGNYVNFWANGNGSSTSSGSDALGPYIGGIYGSNRSLNIIQIMDYATTDKHKTRLSRMAVPGNQIAMIVGRWANTAAVTSLRFTLGANTMSAGTTLSLYGRVA